MGCQHVRVIVTRRALGRLESKSGHYSAVRHHIDREDLAHAVFLARQSKAEDHARDAAWGSPIARRAAVRK